MYALYPNGTLKWKYPTGSDIGSAPTIGDDGTIYFGSTDGYLYALYPNGTLRWKYGAGYIGGSSPAIAEDGAIYIGTGGPAPHRLFSISPNGSKNWAYQTEDEIHSSPAVDKNGIVYVGSFDGWLYAINPDGSLRWKYNTGGAVDSSPAISENGTIYFVAYNTHQPEFFSHLFAVEVREYAADLEISDIKYKLARFKVVFKNVGDVDALNVQWTVKVEDNGASGWVNLEREGVFETLPAGEEKKVLIWPLFGLGYIEITISISAIEATSDYQRVMRTIIGPFIIRML